MRPDIQFFKGIKASNQELPVCALLMNHFIIEMSRCVRAFGFNEGNIWFCLHWSFCQKFVDVKSS